MSDVFDTFLDAPEQDKFDVFLDASSESLPKIDQRVEADLSEAQPQSVFGGITDIRHPYERLNDAGKGVLDAGATLGTGMFFTIASGVGGIQELISSMWRIDDDPLANAIHRIGQIQGYTSPITTPEGEDMLWPVQKLGELIHKGGKFVGDKAFDAAENFNAGDPHISTQFTGLEHDINLSVDPAIAGATAQTATELSPMLLMRGGKPGSITTRRDLNAINATFKKNKIDINKPIKEQLPQLMDAAIKEANVVDSKRFPGHIFPDSPAFKGKNLQIVVDALREAKIKARDIRDAMFDRARKTNAGIPVGEAIKFTDITKESLSKFILYDSNGKLLMPKVVTLLKELETMELKFKGLPEHSSVRLNAVYTFRERINANISKKADKPEDVALISLKHQLDDFVASKFTTDMITGDPAAIAMYKAANLEHFKYKTKYIEDKIVNQLIKQEAIAEEISRLILGASESNFKVLSGGIVQKIENILGKDSAPMTAIRQEAALKLIEPLLESEITTSSLKQFVANYDKAFRNNSSMVQMLFPENASQLKNLVGIARAQSKSALSEIGFVKVTRGMSVFMGAHPIARHGLIVNTVEKILDLVRSQAGMSEKRLMMSNILGYDPLVPPLGLAEIGVASIVQQREKKEAELATIKQLEKEELLNQ